MVNHVRSKAKQSPSMQFLAGRLFFLTIPSLLFDMSEISRKRPHTDDGDVTVAKKRVLTGTNGTPQVNGHSDQTEDEQICQANLEVRKAIYKNSEGYAYRQGCRNSEKRLSIGG